jgi:hypothetical protein
MPVRLYKGRCAIFAPHTLSRSEATATRHVRQSEYEKKKWRRWMDWNCVSVTRKVLSCVWRVFDHRPIIFFFLLSVLRAFRDGKIFCDASGGVCHIPPIRAVLWFELAIIF